MQLEQGAFRRELTGFAGIVERNIYLIRRFAWWEVAWFLHTVANTLDVFAATRGHPWVLALGGHIHATERLVFGTEGVQTRFEQASAIIGGWEVQDVKMPSGFTVYTVRDGVIDAGRFVRLDPP